jgi:MFS family permease
MTNPAALPVQDRALAAAPSRAAFSRGYRTYAMGLLLAISVVNYLDRMVVYILAEPIKTDLHLSDGQLGLLTGLAFGLLYTVMGLPIARLAERHHRGRIVAIACGVWSLFTISCGAAGTFAQLALARVGVGVGEAGCAPASNSLILDYAPPEKRGSALALFGLGAPLGGLLGMAFGGIVAHAFGWRTAFLLAGVPGVILAILAATTLRETRAPRSRGLSSRKVNPDETLGAMFRLVKPKRSYWLLAAAITAQTFVFFGTGPFLASFFLRVHGAELERFAGNINSGLGALGLLGFALGLGSGVFGALGTLLGGLLADRIGPRNPRRYLYQAAVTGLLCVPIFVVMLLTPSLELAIALNGLMMLVHCFWYGPAYAAWFSLVPAHMRATNSAVSLFLANLIGVAMAPLVVGLISDAVGVYYGAAEGIRWGLMAMGLAWLVASCCYLLASRTFTAEMES